MNKLATALAALLLSGTAASALPVSWTVTGSSFSNTVGGTNVTAATQNGGEDATLRWGQPATNAGQSGYNWDGQGGALDLIDGVDTLFQYGVFSHVNQPIFAGTSITGTDLNFTLNIFGYNIPVTLDILHNETTNTGPGNCCDDIVSQTTTFSFDFFNLSGEAVGTISIVPFMFATVEGQTTSKNFTGMMRFDEIPPPPPPEVVPVPAAVPLFMTGLAGIGALSRRKRKKMV